MKVPGVAGVLLMAMRRLVEAGLKRMSEAVLRGPTGGVVWFNAICLNPPIACSPFFGSTEKHDTPATAPPLRTHACPNFSEYAIATGNSPMVETGFPTKVG